MNLQTLGNYTMNAWFGNGHDREEAPEIGRKPRVLIGVAGFHGVIPECQENFFQFAYRCGRDNPEFDFLLKILIKREQFRARNNLVDLAMFNDCEYLLMLDDDMIVPPDLFKRLHSHHKDVVGCLYYQRGGAYHPVIMRQTNMKDGLKGIQFINHFDPIIKNPGLHKIDGVIGGGCMLFNTDVFRKLEQPYFWIDGIVGTDVYVCDRLQRAGIEIWADTSIELGHVGEAQIVTSRNIPEYASALGKVNEDFWSDLKEYFALNDLQLEAEMVRASSGNAREEHWGNVPRETWEQVREYYQSHGDWQILNLAAYNLRFDQARNYAINDLPRLLPKGARIADVGCGNGYVSYPLAEKGFKVTGLDIALSPTSVFFNWRTRAHCDFIGFENPVPPDLNDRQDCILLISVFDHLFDPKGMMEWITRNTKPGAYLVCDSWRTLHKDDEPQHIIKMDPHKVEKEFKKLGWRLMPENPYLFKKEG
jgi:2-polyprenyl-3-methyl-5-hydroxy-6-metoxy-1,4-benzoquinol methylase